MEVPNEVVSNWILDLRKKDISPHQRALLIKSYITNNKLSQRSFSKEFGIHKSTVEDWLLWLKITDDEYKSLLDKGASKTMIYRTLRDNKDKSSDEIKMDFENELDLVLWKCYSRLKPYTTYFKERSEKTSQLIREVKELIEVLDNHYCGGK